MIYVLITVKPSVRYPGKNIRLFNYTRYWLEQEQSELEEPVIVYTVGVRTELPSNVPSTWHHIEYLSGSHEGDISYAESLIAPSKTDVLVLAQVTQPIRRHGLLKDVVETARLYGSVVTACRTKIWNWRILQDQGEWSPKEERYQLLLDGSLYAWTPGNVSRIFSPDMQHGVVVNYKGYPVDIDYKEDIPKSLDSLYVQYIIGDQLAGEQGGGVGITGC